MPTSSEHFYKGSDLNDRLRFFGSALYKDFIERRMSALLGEARQTTDPAERKALLAVLGQLCAGQSEDCSSIGGVHREAMWAPMLVGEGAPEGRVRFAFEDATAVADRINSAAAFVAHAGSGIKWEALKAFVDPRS